MLATELANVRRRASHTAMCDARVRRAQCVACALCAVLKWEIADNGGVLHGFANSEKPIGKRPVARERDAVRARTSVTAWSSAEPRDEPAVGPQQAARAHEQRRFPGRRSGRNTDHLARGNVQMDVAEDRDSGGASAHAGVIALPDAAHRKTVAHRARRYHRAPRGTSSRERRCERPYAARTGDAMTSRSGASVTGTPPSAQGPAARAHGRARLGGSRGLVGRLIRMRRNTTITTASVGTAMSNPIGPSRLPTTSTDMIVSRAAARPSSP